MNPLIYIAGPYKLPDPVVNTRTAIEVAEQVERICGGEVGIIIPHLSMLWHFANPADETLWYDRDNQILDHCHALVRFPGRSKGADMEVVRALKAGMPVFHQRGDWACELYGWHQRWKADWPQTDLC